MIHFTDLDRESTHGQFQFDCHAGTTYEVQFLKAYSVCTCTVLLKKRDGERKKETACFVVSVYLH